MFSLTSAAFVQAECIERQIHEELCLSVLPRNLNMTTQAFRIYAVSFLLAGFNIYSSAFFTALNNGLVSAIIAFVRTLVCECGAVMIMPLFFGITGIWTAIIVAEVFAMIVSVYYLKTLKRKYKY